VVRGVAKYPHKCGSGPFPKGGAEARKKSADATREKRRGCRRGKGLFIDSYGSGFLGQEERGKKWTRRSCHWTGDKSVHTGGGKRRRRSSAERDGGTPEFASLLRLQFWGSIGEKCQEEGGRNRVEEFQEIRSTKSVCPSNRV